MKVKITMEADITKLPAFRNDTPFDAGRENIYDVIQMLYIHSIQKLIAQIAKEKTTPSETQIALLRAYQDECDLAEQLTKNIKIEFS